MSIAGDMGESMGVTSGPLVVTLLALAYLLQGKDVEANDCSVSRNGGRRRRAIL